MPDISEEFENRHRRNLLKYKARIEQIYNDAINKAAKSATGLNLPAGRFSLNRIPFLNSQVNQILGEMRVNVQTVIVNGTVESWDLANKKNTAYVDRRLSNRIKDLPASAIFYDPNTEAMRAFMNRKINGLNLSDRVWTNVNTFRNELESGLGLGISNGQSATAMASELKQYLRDPDKLFRRVRDAQGNLQLSNAALNYHPGRGVYRSSYKNALRLTGTQTNMAYRESDHARWQNLPFVVGQEIKLSNRHPEYDICDTCAGRYPKDFVFNGWHVQCICYKIPIMMSDAEYNRYEDSLLAGRNPRVISENIVKDVPESFKKYVSENQERIKGWSSAPSWVKDNFKNGNIDNALKIKTSIDPLKVTGDYTLNPESITRLKDMGVTIEGESIIAAEFNSRLKGFDLETLFKDFDLIGKEHDITWTKKSVIANGSSRGSFLVTKHIGRTGHGDVYIERHFRTENGKTDVYHAYFKIPEALQGGGISKKVLSSYYKQYVNSGIDKISVYANIDVGGYTWAKYGFGAADKHEILSIIRSKSYYLTDKESSMMKRMVEKHFTDNPDKPFPMRRIADLGAGSNYHYGKKVLLGTDWAGELHLSDKKIRRIFEDYLYGKKK